MSQDLRAIAQRTAEMHLGGIDWFTVQEWAEYDDLDLTTEQVTEVHELVLDATITLPGEP